MLQSKARIHLPGEVTVCNIDSYVFTLHENDPNLGQATTFVVRLFEARNNLDDQVERSRLVSIRLRVISMIKFTIA